MVKWEQLSASEGGRDNNMELAKNLETPRLVIRSCRKTDTDFILLGEAYGSTKSATFYPPVAGTYNVIVRVKDAKAKVSKKGFTVKAGAASTTL